MVWYKNIGRKATQRKASKETVIEEITEEQIEGLIQAYERMKAEYYANQKTV